MNKAIIQKELLYLGVKPHYKGFEYLTKALELYKPGMQIWRLYRLLSEEYKVSSASVERNIRTARETMLDSEIATLEKKLKDRYGIEVPIGDNIPNVEFIALLKIAMEGLNKSNKNNN